MEGRGSAPKVRRLRGRSAGYPGAERLKDSAAGATLQPSGLRGLSPGKGLANMPDQVTLAIDHVAKLTKLVAETKDDDTRAKASHESRDRAIRDAIDDGWTPKRLERAGVGLSESTLYRVVGTAD